jgi:hypothetical protein
MPWIAPAEKDVTAENKSTAVYMAAYRVIFP